MYDTKKVIRNILGDKVSRNNKGDYLLCNKCGWGNPLHRRNQEDKIIGKTTKCHRCNSIDLDYIEDS